MVKSIYRDTKIIVSKSAIRHNIEEELKMMKPCHSLFAVVKANAYGHGAVEVSKIACEAGVSGFCVATLDEGLELRENGIILPILVLAPIPVSALGIAIENEISVTVASLEWWRNAQEALNTMDKTTPLKIHIKIDSGMGRIGLRKQNEVDTLIQDILSFENVVWEGIFTHFATADSADDSYYQQQSETFKKLTANLPFQPKYVHVSNTATSFWHEEHEGNMVRFGIGMYGLNPSGKELAPLVHLEEAMQVKSSLIHVKKMGKGSSVGYGSTYICKEDEWIGTVAIGYADGWLRGMQAFSVLVDGKRCEIVGRVCMDQMMIRLPEKREEGEEVVLVGESNGESIRLQEVADYIGTIHYEVCCQFSDRIPREYEE